MASDWGMNLERGRKRRPLGPALVYLPVREAMYSARATASSGVSSRTGRVSKMVMPSVVMVVSSHRFNTNFGSAHLLFQHTGKNDLDNSFRHQASSPES